MSTATEPRATEPRHPPALLGGRAGDGRLAAILVVVAPALLALGLCLYQLTTRSLWLDESATVSIASQHGAAFGSALARDGGNMLAYYALLHVLIGWFGTGELVLRLPAAIGGAATAGLVAMLGLRLANVRVAFAAGILTAVSLSLVYWGQNARGYTPMIALIVASFVALVALLEGRGRIAWLAYVVSMTAAVYVGLEAVLVIPAQLLVLVWFRDRWRQLASAVAVTALCCVPLGVLAAERGAGQLFWVPSPNFDVVKQVVQALTSSALQPSFYASTRTALTALTLIVLALGLVRAIRTGRDVSPGAAAATPHGPPAPVDRHPRAPVSRDPRAPVPRDPRWRPVLMLAWLLVPAILALIESAVAQSIFQARYLLVSLPAVSLLAAWALADRPLLARRRWGWGLSLGVFAAMIVLRALQLAPAYGVSPENWRSATAYVSSNAQPRDCVAFYPLDGRMAFRYYLRDFARAPRPILPTLPWTRVQSFVEDYASLSGPELAQLPARCGRVWLLTRRGGGVGGTPVSRANSLRYKRLARSLAQEYPRSSAADFGTANLVTVTLYSR